MLSEFPGKIKYTLKVQKGNAEPNYCRSRFMSRSSRGSSCGLVFGSNLFTILMSISGENGIVANSYGYLSKAFLGFSPKLGCALAPYMLLKKRLDLEAPAATTIGEPFGEFKSRARKTHSLNLSGDSR
ncbi:MAG TPA: hypothetical protein VGA05_05135 [Candidatus Bathyarchaeia archaeon]